MQTRQSTPFQKKYGTAHWFMYSEKFRRLIARNKQILLLALIAFLIRLLFISNPNLGTGDTGANNVATQAFLEGKAVYSLPGISESIPPFSLHLLSLWRIVGMDLGYDFTEFWKVLSALFDSLLVVLIYGLAVRMQWSRKVAFYGAMMYAFNPVSIVISAVHGQIEPIWLFFTLLSYYLLLSNKKRFLASAVVFGIGASVKLVPLLLLPFLVLYIGGWIRRFRYVTVVMVTMLILSFPELYNTFPAVYKQVLSYSGTPGMWGLSRLVAVGTSHGLVSIAMANQVNSILKIVMLALICTYWLNQIRRRNVDFVYSSLTALLLFLIFTPGFGTQYVLWIVPFLILSRSSFTKWYLLFGSLVMFTSYDVGIRPISLIAGLLNTMLTGFSLTFADIALLMLWGACVVYGVRRVRSIDTSVKTASTL